ncbi:MAG TPA: Phenylacetic acid catabolic protein [Longimicrobiales bacterium]|nr:Phenylacetic acid catabolic protein [Longimicrobiales bacterium]
MTTKTKGSAAGPATVPDGVRDLILVLADSKRLLGYRYAEWMLGAPELETGIALSSMAQDEWGHARLLYALLKDTEDVDALEHGRDASGYRNIQVLDAPTASWADTVALMALVDVALSVQFEALRSSSHDPLRQRVEKMLEEERFHAAHGAAWFRRMANGTDASAAALKAAVEAVLEPVLAWFGRDDGRSAELVEAGVVDSGGSTLRERFVARIAPLLELVGIAATDPSEPEAGDYDEARRRVGGGGPDEATIARVRGDRNRAFLMD